MKRQKSRRIPFDLDATLRTAVEPVGTLVFERIYMMLAQGDNADGHDGIGLDVLPRKVSEREMCAGAEIAVAAELIARKAVLALLVDHDRIFVRALIDDAKVLRARADAERTRGGNPAAKLATMRHAKHYALLDDARRYWRETIDPKLSASKAADMLLRVSSLQHRTLAALVSAEKKKQS